jgi:hypothetical protein
MRAHLTLAPVRALLSAATAEPVKPCCSVLANALSPWPALPHENFDVGDVFITHN